MVVVTPHRRLPQDPLLSLGSGSTADIYYGGQSTFPFLVEITHSACEIVVSGSNTHSSGERILFAEGSCPEKPSFPSVLLSEGMLSFILSYWFKTIIQYAWTPISALSSSERIDLRPWSASLSDWCTVEMKTGQITNEIWLRFPRAPAVRQDGERVCETFGLKQTQIWITPPFMSPTSHCRLVLRWGMGCCEWVSVGLPPLMARKCLCWRD